MESMVDHRKIFGGIYSGKRVLITGHTGFKGAWLAHWLTKMGADVVGFSLSPSTKPNHSELLETKMQSFIGDITDLVALKNCIDQVQPDIVFHLAAQALVRDSYESPIETYRINVIGTMHVYEACRACPSVKAVVNITSDKAYENKEWTWGYRENDPMGGYDPYSSSKGCAELLTASYRNSFLHVSGSFLLASVRAGNVIGGGDWAKDRLIPDIVRATSENKVVQIRNPKATRPWQHVLEPLSGYLMVGWKLLQGNTQIADGWNFGPDLSSNLTVGEVTALCIKEWGKISVEINTDPNQVHEAHLLMLDCSKAQKQLHWKPVWNIDETIHHTIGWYKKYYTDKTIITDSDINAYVLTAKEKHIEWTL